MRKPEGKYDFLWVNRCSLATGKSIFAKAFKYLHPISTDCNINCQWWAHRKKKLVSLIERIYYYNIWNDDMKWNAPAFFDLWTQFHAWNVALQSSKICDIQFVYINTTFCTWLSNQLSTIQVEEAFFCIFWSCTVCISWHFFFTNKKFHPKAMIVLFLSFSILFCYFRRTEYNNIKSNKKAKQ